MQSHWRSATGSPTRSLRLPVPPSRGWARRRARRGAGRRRADAFRRRPADRADRAGLREVSPAIMLRRTSQPPIVGAALLGLDRSGHGPGRAGSAPRGVERGGRETRDDGGGLMADVRYEQATRIYDGTDAPAVDALDLDDRRRRVPRARRPIGLGQDDCAADARRARAGRRGQHLDRRARGDRPAPKQRDVAMVFQNYALYPYLSVAANIAFPLRIARVPKSERERRVRRSRSCSASSRTSSAARASSPAVSASASRWGARSSASRASS